MAKQSIRMVMVEDTAADAELILRGLKRSQLDCEVRRVDTEAAFLTALQEHRPQLILSDFSMPQFDGLRALELAVQWAPEVPFIFVSGTIGEERAIDALRRGATDYVLKSNLARLAAAIERALEEATLKRARREAEEQLRDNERRLRDTVVRLQRLTRTYRMLSSTGSAILRLRERGELLQEICRIAVQQGGYERVVIGLCAAHESQARPQAWAGEAGASLHTVEQSLLKRCESGASGAAGAAQAALIENDLASSQGATLPASDEEPAAGSSQPERERLLAEGYRSFAALPLRVDGTVVGALLLLSRQGGVFDAAERQVLEELTANLGFALQYLQKDEAVQFLSYYDSLTGLAKRLLFCQRLDLQLRSAAAASRSVLVFDVQQLGAINDSYGRYVGDALIGEIALRLKQAHGSDAAYLGAGTFALHCDSAAAAADAMPRLPQAVAGLFAEPFRVEGQELRPAVRAGLAVHPEDATSADQLVQQAEGALKAAREDNERFLPYGLIRQRPDSRSLALEVRLAAALERNEFLLHYQPKVDLQSGRVVGLEALLRWQDASEGLISPAVFVPLLERSGAIAEVGEWVLQQAVRDAALWQQPGVEPVRIAVNVSPLQLRRRDFVERVLSSVRAVSRQPPGIDVEITESMLMQDLELSIRKLQELLAAGIGVAIDDFGTGYSSLRMLARLPVDTLKIDRYFIQGMTESASGVTLVATVVSLAEAFGMKVVAEGVETPEQAQLLRRMRCPQAQGYLFARPAPAAQVQQVIERLNGAGSVP